MSAEVRRRGLYAEDTTAMHDAFHDVKLGTTAVYGVRRRDTKAPSGIGAEARPALRGAGDPPGGRREPH